MFTVWKMPPQAKFRKEMFVQLEAEALKDFWQKRLARPVTWMVSMTKGAISG